jgi:hypothetical protein
LEVYHILTYIFIHFLFHLWAISYWWRQTDILYSFTVYSKLNILFLCATDGCSAAQPGHGHNRLSSGCQKVRTGSAIQSTGSSTQMSANATPFPFETLSLNCVCPRLLSNFCSRQMLKKFFE